MTVPSGSGGQSGPSGPDAPSPSTRAARVLVQALHALGVRDAVLAPGSRSAPLAYALAEAAAGVDGAPAGLRLHVRVDERDAGFLALGLARAAVLEGSARPVAVVTTSGTAVANLHPAVLEAHHSGVPLLLLTADRPHELRGTGANQTTEQVGLLDPCRLVLDVPATTGRDGEERDLRHLASRAVAAALGSRTSDPGPVHLNVAFREPLVPGGEPWPVPSRVGLTEVGRRGAALGAEPWHAPATAALVNGTGGGALSDGRPQSSPGATAAQGVQARRTVVVAGDGAGAVARRIAEAQSWPLLAEPSSGARAGHCAIPAYRLVLAAPAHGGRDGLVGAIERVVVLGRPTLSRPVQALLGRPDVEVLVLAPTGRDWTDATRSADQVLCEVPPALLVPAVEADGDWLGAWRRAGQGAVEAVRRAGEERTASDGSAAVPLTGPQVADAVAGTLGPDDVLVVGSSNPVRDLDLVAQWDEAPLVVANRGLAGIDGTVSTAAGLALGLGRPVRALMGDLTFLHDVGGLLLGPTEQEPDLQVVVANDDGGSIFATLEHGEVAARGPAYAAVVERVFGTPHGADLGALCAGYGVAHRVVGTLSELRDALGEPVRGRSVVEVRVDRRGRRALAEAIRPAGAGTDGELPGTSQEGSSGVPVE